MKTRNGFIPTTEAERFISDLIADTWNKGIDTLSIAEVLGMTEPAVRGLLPAKETPVCAA